jgi:hypothetical protein
MSFLIKYSDLKEYHNFSDKRKILNIPNIPNAYNVFSNIAILLPAFYLIIKEKKDIIFINKSDITSLS